MKRFIALSSTILGASAYPFVFDHAQELQARHPTINIPRDAYSPSFNEIFGENSLLKRQTGNDPLGVSKSEKNCGPIPCTMFDESQLVSVTGLNRWIKPAQSDIRGPCPGLNAAANHGYLNRNGIQDVQSTTQGLMDAYGFAPDFAAALNAFSAVISGDIVTQQWSIGGPMPFVNVGGLLSPPQGISYSHNRYEGDVSIGRNDAYLGHGDAYSLNVTRFGYAYATCTKTGGCTMDGFRQAFLQNVYRSVSENPYYFSPPLAGAVVPPAAYNFVINFMSNHSAANPNGILSRKNFKEFFSVTGKPGAFKWHPGQERIPNNWYRRPQTNQYGAATLVADDAIGWAAYPDGLRIGGNTNGVNTYEGADIATLTGGQYTSLADLTSTPNGLGCLAFQSMQQIAIDELKGTTSQIASALAFLSSATGPSLASLDCPALQAYNTSAFSPYPGASYNPQAPNNQGQFPS